MPPSPAPNRLRCWVEINLSALERNLRHIRASLPPRIKYVAVVKADAYGHGLAQTVSRLMRSGADLFAVANLREAAEIQEIGSGWPILVLSALLPEEDDLLAELQVIPAVSSVEEVERFGRVARAAGRVLPVHLKIDTGMGRLGVWHEQAADLYARLRAEPSLFLDGVFTHFSCADCDPAYTAGQRDLFFQVLRQLPGLDPARLLIHADNSAGLDSFAADGPCNGARVGLLQFGVAPYAQSLLADVPVEPVLSFHTRVGLVKHLPAGTGISYGRTCLLRRDTRVAVLTAGYADGIPRTLSNTGHVLLHGRRCPILGRVTMDQTIVDAQDLPEVAVGDVATLIGRQEAAEIPVTEFCAGAGHIPWEVFTSITKRVQRIYRIDSAV